MKSLKSLNSLFLLIIFFCLVASSSNSNEPVDIWNIEKKAEKIKNNKINNDNNLKNNSTQLIKAKKENDQILFDDNLETKSIKLAGLYDPAENGLSIDMWSNSDGKEIKNILEKIGNKNLSKYSSKILDITLLTNSYIPNQNISSQEFLDFKSQYLIKKGDYDLIKNFLKKKSIT